jgi:sucrose-6-phosphate hydrolase SacC (GH32 family)
MHRQSRRTRTRAVPAATASLAAAAALTLTAATGESPAADHSHRPQVHFTPAENWINDPNGLVYHDGLYHLYFQHNPEGDRWGNMSWGHATSPDLVHWEEQPLAIPHTEEEHIFSGGIVFDEHNTSGLGTDEDPPLVAVYTSAYTEASEHAGIQAQSLAHSTDGGHTWEKYGGNPVLDINHPDFRDPKVFWHEQDSEGYWVMAVVVATERVVHLYRSDDLQDWEFMSDFGPEHAVDGIWEVPDLFELPVDGDPDDTRWVMIVNLNPGAVAGGSGAQYFVGDFDGTTFTPEHLTDSGDLADYDWLDWGRDYYAAVSYNDTPDDARVTMAWMSNWEYAEDTPTQPWRGAMALPRELSLETVDGRPQLVQNPVRQVDDLLGEPVTEHPEILVEAHGVDLITPKPGQAYQVDLTLRPGDARESGLRVHQGGGQATVIGYDTSSGELFVDRTDSGDTGFHEAFPGRVHAPAALTDGALELRVVVDASSVEVFAAGGRVTLTELVFPGPDTTGAALYTEGADSLVEDLRVSPLTTAHTGAAQ